MIKKYIFIMLLSFPISGLASINTDILEGTWYRTYGIYRPWADDNQGTISYYEETLIFHHNNTVLIYDNSGDNLKGKSVFTITTRDNKDFIVFHTPDQNPEDDQIQKKQGYFITLEHDKDELDVLTFITVKEYSQKKKKIKGINYHKVQMHEEEPKFIVPNNKI